MFVCTVLITVACMFLLLAETFILRRFRVMLPGYGARDLFSQRASSGLLRRRLLLAELTLDPLLVCEVGHVRPA